jgi:hypothetical protein
VELPLIHPRILRSVCSAIPQLPCYPIDSCILWKQPLKTISFLPEWEIRQPGSLDKDTYYRMIYEFGEAHQRVDRFQEAEYCSDM